MPPSSFSGSFRRNNPFLRGSSSNLQQAPTSPDSVPVPGPGPGSGPGPQAPQPPQHVSRPRSTILPSSIAEEGSFVSSASTGRTSTSTPSTATAGSSSDSASGGLALFHTKSSAKANRQSVGPNSNTFAPKFIKDEESRRAADTVQSQEGDNDFSGRRYVWLRDAEHAFIRGEVIEDTEDGQLLVLCDDGSQREVDPDSVDKVNPAKFDKADDMAELTHLNEGSVIHNLHERYKANLIYTYSGLFLVTVNPYCPLPIYTNEYIERYKGKTREDTKPHIFAVADLAFRNLVEEGENQSILVTGESGAGKTENTKKVIQYLAAVASSNQFENLSQQILQANPILEAFGNAQTVRNNNSSRFGKFIRIQLSRQGQICGAHIDWYLFEKSRVVRLNTEERNYHVFYQVLRGADQQLKERLKLGGLGISDFAYTRHGNNTIDGVSDEDEWDSLMEAFEVIGFSREDQEAILRTVAAVLHLGNVTVVKESLRADQAALGPDAQESVDKACELLGIESAPFVKSLLHPKVKAGREWVQKVQTPEQVSLALDALAKSVYERGFGDLVNRINGQLDRVNVVGDDFHFIGVLDIAGFEIFENNSFEQLCINYTNEKLQQFFNHHMFVLEQEEYAKERIDWQFIDFGKDLQPTIDLIELPNPIGIFSCLDEDSVMPKATDKSFTDKLHSLWDRKSEKYRAVRLSQGFVLTHYAAEVEYSTEGWLEKNKDPLSENLTRLLSGSKDPHVAMLFADCADPEDTYNATKSRVKKGLFRTVAQRHKEQLSSLMTQLHLTHPHFVRCILPNSRKRPKLFNGPLVLDQLRCNGVLEGIRIARTGFPNRLAFSEFRQRYEVLCRNMPKGRLDGQSAAMLIVQKLGLDPSFYRVGLTKMFFRAGVLAELEEQRDTMIREIMTSFQAASRGLIARRRAGKRLYRTEAAKIIRQNLVLYQRLKASPWWNLYNRMRPLLGGTRIANEVKQRDEQIKALEEKAKKELVDRQKLEEERRRAETVIAKVQQTLESERALALDKEEIFKRLQAREVELSDKLAEAIADQEDLEDQLDQIIEGKKKVEADLETRISQLTEAADIIARLEMEKKETNAELERLDQQLKKAADGSHQRNEEFTELIQEIELLKSYGSIREHKIQELEAQLLKTDQDLDVKLAETSKDLDASRQQIKELVDENRKIRAEMSDVSTTLEGYEDLLRDRESQLSVLRADIENYESHTKDLEMERSELATRYEDVQSRLYDVQAQMDAMMVEKVNLEREAAHARQLLDAKADQDHDAVETMKMLDEQVQDLKEQLYKVQTELSRERQSRDDVQMLGEHKFEQLKEAYNSLNESKVVIEKEMYAQQDALRRATEAREVAEDTRRELQNELIKLRERYTALENEKLDAVTDVENKLLTQASERQATLRRELAAKTKEVEDLDAERVQLSQQVQDFRRLMAESEVFKIQHDQHKERLERELTTIKGRLTASENDNRALLNKIQQKNLDIARSNSRADAAQRAKVQQLQAEKQRLEDSNRDLRRQLGDAQLTVTSFEKQKEKLSLSLEDLNHEIAREHKAARTAEKASSTINMQLAEANRNLETERQLRTQAQSNTRQLQTSLDHANKELETCHQQLIGLVKMFNIESDNNAFGDIQPEPSVSVPKSNDMDVNGMLSELQTTVRVAEERRARAESQLAEMRRRHADEVAELDAQYQSSKKTLLGEIDQNKPPNKGTGRARGNSDPFKRLSAPATPSNRRGLLGVGVTDSARSDRTVDSAAYQKRMDLAAELEMLQNKLQMTEMQNRHLQNQLGRANPTDQDGEESPSIRRMKMLEKENIRLHEKLDDSAQKVSALEKSIHSGEISMRDIQAKSHEELYELINSQEQSRRSLLQTHQAALADLTQAKAQFDTLKQLRANLEVELRDTRSELKEIKERQGQDAESRNQLLSEFSDLQIRLDAEESKSIDLASSLSLYKTRADEYFNKLEQAEIAVLKATRAEQFARSQAREAEETCATIMAERKQMEGSIEDLQRQVQSNDEKIEDLSADLEAALQAKRRLQNELEDYRTQRAMDIEDKETSMEQTRKKYQMEFSTLNNELEIERENVLHIREDNARLQAELDELRSKWDNEVLNSSTWAKEKSRLEITLQDLSKSRDETVKAHDEAQSKVVSLLSQVRSLRASVDEISAERDSLLKEKRTLETRLGEANDRFADLAGVDNPSTRNAAVIDRELLDLKTKLARQEDLASAAVGKMRRAEAIAAEMQKERAAEREASAQLFKDKANLEKQLKEIQLRCVDLETKGYSSGSQDVRFWHKRIQELESQLEEIESRRTADQRSVRNVDRTVKDLQSQIERRDKANAQLAEDIAKSRDKIERLLQTIDELQSSDSENQLQARRAERELREEREKSLRLERELDGWKALRTEKGSVRGSVIARSQVEDLAERWGNNRRESGAFGGSVHGDVVQRKVSNTKGFL
ncbi:NineTeen Complex (NTC) component [Ascosphaera pollenicola]|nr:NineTeen Complex (NTC) component [Ascosphaera pollenicola]